jgi:26S proteasome regulatory subunit N9
VDPDVSAAYYFSKSLLHKQQKNFAEFYKSSLLYLAFISSEGLPQDVKLVSWNLYLIILSGSSLRHKSKKSAWATFGEPVSTL